MFPDFQSLMRRLLDELSDGSIRRTRDLVGSMSDRFGLTEEERAARVPSGQQRRIANRVSWAISHLFQAGLLERPARGQVAITAAGRDVLAAHSDRIDMGVLRDFESYRHVRSRSSRLDTSGDGPLSSEPEVDAREPGRRRR
jgi:restriction system protein